MLMTTGSPLANVRLEKGNWTRQWWRTPLIQALGRQRWADLCGFKASLAEDMQKPCLKPTPHPQQQKQQQKKKEKKKKEKRRKGNWPLLRMPPVDLAILLLTLLPRTNSRSRTGALPAKAKKHHRLTMPRTSNGLRCYPTLQFSFL